MKVVILAGGFGSRISEESVTKPKPMVEIGERPILWHIMKNYSMQGFNEFIICLGYKGHVIKQFFAEYFLQNADITFDISSGDMTVHKTPEENWKVTLVDTGLKTMTGGRIKRIKDYIDGDTFMLTYGDGVSDVDVNKLLEFHKSHGKLATLTAFQPDGRFGVLGLEDNSNEITTFREKNKNDGGWINAGFMVLNKKVIDYVEGDATMFENEPLERIAKDGELMAYRHTGKWHCMDTLRDKLNLEAEWYTDKAFWKNW